MDELSQRLNRKVNPTIYTPAELAKRVDRSDAFLRRVLEQPQIWVIGGENAIGI